MTIDIPWSRYANRTVVWVSERNNISGADGGVSPRVISVVACDLHAFILKEMACDVQATNVALFNLCGPMALRKGEDNSGFVRQVSLNLSELGLTNCASVRDLW